MVKNTKGGSSHKSQARKFVTSKSSSRTRFVKEEGELYAFVTNKSGGDNCLVMCQDDVSRRCVIRGKFRSSRGKRDNFIAKGTWVLVGVRDWSSSSGVCDLLEVYNEHDKQSLKTIPGINWNKFISHDVECTSKETTSGGYDQDTFEFTNDTTTEEFEELVAASKSTITLQSIEENEVEENINVDDI